MKLKMRIMTTLLGLVFGCGIAASQTPRAEQTMNSKRQYIAEVAALTSMGAPRPIKNSPYRWTE